MSTLCLAICVLGCLVLLQQCEEGFASSPVSKTSGEKTENHSKDKEVSMLNKQNEMKNGGHKGSVNSGPANSGPANSGPANSGPANSGPANSGPANSRSANSGPGSPNRRNKSGSGTTSHRSSSGSTHSHSSGGSPKRSQVPRAGNSRRGKEGVIEVDHIPTEEEMNDEDVYRAPDGTYYASIRGPFHEGPCNKKKSDVESYKKITEKLHRKMKGSVLIADDEDSVITLHLPKKPPKNDSPDLA